ALAGYALSVLGRGWFARAAAVVLAMSTVFLLGWIWLAFWMGADFKAALWAGVLPFLPGDAVKAAVAFGVASKVEALGGPRPMPSQATMKKEA
ncbi:MAG: biotin transporter BioY, partial [Candidatus Verstraetearchaeota archaeon]|nr:biotin transporter BioY [Candidatus Verstraetearchaeota archaeon]